MGMTKERDTSGTNRQLRLSPRLTGLAERAPSMSARRRRPTTASPPLGHADVRLRSDARSAAAGSGGVVPVRCSGCGSVVRLVAPVARDQLVAAAVLGCGQFVVDSGAVLPPLHETPFELLAGACVYAVRVVRHLDQRFAERDLGSDPVGVLGAVSYTH